MHSEQAETVQEHRRFMDAQTMSDPQTHATQGALLDVFTGLSEKIEQSHKSLRESITVLAGRLDLEAREVRDRVLVIETLRTAEKEEQAREKARVIEDVNRRIAGISILVGILGTIVGHFWK